MNCDRTDSRLYSQLMRCKADTKREIFIYLFVILLLLLLGILSVFGVYHNEGPESAIGLALAFIVGAGVYSFFSLRKLKDIIAVNKKRAERASSLGDAELSSLEAQIERADFQYNTFYVLDEFFYVPKIKLLIRYSEIAEFKNIIHSTNGIKDSVMIAITDTCGLVYEVRVKQWKEYYKYCRTTAETIYDKIKSSERKIEI